MVTAKQERELLDAYGFVQALHVNRDEKYCQECLQKCRVVYEDRPIGNPGRIQMCRSCIVKVYSFGTNGS